jgi:hypothetical protein
LSRPRESLFMGSAGTCASWIWPHLVHRRVQCSNPERAAMMRLTCKRDWHFRQRRRSAARGDEVGMCRSGIALPCIGRERYRTLCHRKMPRAGGDAFSLHPPPAGMLVNVAHSRRIPTRLLIPASMVPRDDPRNHPRNLSKAAALNHPAPVRRWRAEPVSMVRPSVNLMVEIGHFPAWPTIEIRRP